MIESKDIDFEVAYSKNNRMKKFVEEGQSTDPLIHPPDKKNNPWLAKVTLEYI